MKDDDQKKFTPQLAMDTESRICHSLYNVKPKAQLERSAPYWAIGN
jgi:hypothetical protein